MPENITDLNLDSIEAAEQDAGIVVHYTEYPTVGQQVVSAIISVAAPLAVGFGVLGAMAVAGTIVEKVRDRRATRKASKIETVAVPADQTPESE